MRIRIRNGEVMVADRDAPGLRVCADDSELNDAAMKDLYRSVDRAMFVSDRTHKAPPCTICGGRARFVREGGPGYRAKCTGCGIMTSLRPTINQALDEWTYIMTRNTREIGQERMG